MCSKQNSFILSLISLWLQKVIGGYTRLQHYQRLVKTEQLYFFPYITLVTNGYRWLQHDYSL